MKFSFRRFAMLAIASCITLSTVGCTVAQPEPGLDQGMDQVVREDALARQLARGLAAVLAHAAQAVVLRLRAEIGRASCRERVLPTV